jgi:hypothetical protein
MTKHIQVEPSDLAEALQIERKVSRLSEELHAAQHDLERLIAHMRILYKVPPDYVLTNWLEGFQPAGEQNHGE